MYSPQKLRLIDTKSYCIYPHCFVILKPTPYNLVLKRYAAKSANLEYCAWCSQKYTKKNLTIDRK